MILVASFEEFVLVIKTLDDGQQGRAQQDCKSRNSEFKGLRELTSLSLSEEQIYIW